MDKFSSWLDVQIRMEQIFHDITIARCERGDSTNWGIPNASAIRLSELARVKQVLKLASEGE